MTLKNSAIFLNEELTKTRDEIFFQSRLLKASGNISVAPWTDEGKVMIKRQATDQPVKITKVAQLNQFKNRPENI